MASLWFLINLTLYTLFLWPIFALRDQIARAVPKPPLLLAALVIASAASVVLLKPYEAALTGDNYQFVLYLIFFLGGYLIGADHVQVLDWAKRQTWWLLASAIILFIIKATLLTLALIDDLDTGQALAEGGWVTLGLSPQNATVFSIVEAATAWFWCVAALGLASRFLNRPGRLLPAFNRAVFPLYVLHFPLTLVGLALAAQFSAPWWIEFFVLLVFVYTGSWILWRIFDHIGPAAFLVGGKPSSLHMTSDRDRIHDRSNRAIVSLIRAPSSKTRMTADRSLRQFSISGEHLTAPVLTMLRSVASSSDGGERSRVKFSGIIPCESLSPVGRVAFSTFRSTWRW